MKLLDVEPSPLPTLIPLGPKYSLRDPVFKYSYPAFLPHVSQLYITVGYIIAVYILIIIIIILSMLLISASLNSVREYI